VAGKSNTVAESDKNESRVEVIIGALDSVRSLLGYVVVLATCIAWIVAATGYMQLVGVVLVVLWLAFGIWTIHNWVDAHSP
jgi:hypothetical protein